MTVSESSASHERELRILTAVAEALNSAPDVRQALQQTLALAADLLGLRTGWVWLIDPDTGRFYNAAAQNLPPYLHKSVRMTGYACWCIQSFQEGRLAAKNIDILECSRLRPAVQKQEEALTEGLRYHASIPLYFRETPLGIMNVTSPTWRRLTKEELRILSTIAYQTGIAIERARLAEAAARLARAEERARIARDIHDTLAQGLTGISLHIEGALNVLERDPARARERLESALVTSRQSLEDARRSVLDLRATPLHEPLPEALSALARTFTSETGVRVRVHVSGQVALPVEAETELYRIAQEALTNVQRHAQAQEVTISVRGGTRSVRLAIGDDGQGFEPAECGEGRHGLLGMRERTRLLGGRFRLKSSHGAGTQISVTVPVEKVT